jgi:hypothetical protein
LVVVGVTMFRDAADILENELEVVLGVKGTETWGVFDPFH